MQRLIVLCLGLTFLVLTPSLRAQQKTEFFVGYSYLRPPVSVVEQPVYCPVEFECSGASSIATRRESLNGWEGSVTRHLFSYLGVTADASGNYGRATTGFPLNGRAHQYTYLAGPVISRPSHFSPFVHALFGASYQSATHSGNGFLITFPDNKWGFAAAAGAGVDLRVIPNFSFRPIQVDYLLTRFSNGDQGQVRLSAGFVFRF